MIRNRWLLWFALIAAACGAAIWNWSSRPSQTGWNVVVITLDTTRADHIGCYGADSALTPVLDELAKNGVLFESAYAPAPLTLSSHATMFTGLLPPEHGLITNGKGRLPADVRTLAEVLSDFGYSTSAFIASYVLNARFGLDQGMRHYDDDLTGTPKPHDQLHRERRGDVVVDAALKWLAEQKTSKFHCWIHLYDPHFPYQPHEDRFGDRFRNAPYDAEIAFVDQQVGRILDFLRAERLDTKTLVVVVGDHGEGLHDHEEPTHGYLLYQSTMHVPLIIAPPLEARRGTRVAQAVSLVDLFPTVLELLQLPIPEPITGSSLAGVWRNEPVVARDCFAMTDEPFLDNHWSPLRSLTTDRWKYIRSPQAELYDLSADPAEQTNLLERHPDQVAALEKRLSKMEEALRVREIADPGLSDKEKRTLASLGYAGGQSNRQAAPADSLVDVKEMLPFYNRLNAALELLEQGRPAEAEAALREIVAAAPTYQKAVGNLGICLAQQEKWDEAIDCYQRVLAIDPQDASALMNLAAAHAANGRVNAAIDVYSKALEADPDSAVACLRLGLLYSEAGDAQEAVAHFAQALEIDPEFDEAHRAWGDFAAANGDFRTAHSHFDAALKLNPRSVTALANKGILDARTGHPESARRLLLQALDVDPQNVQVRGNLAVLHEQQGRIAEAASEYEAILQQAPEHFPALMSLGRIRAAHPDRSIRDSSQAVELAERACRISNRQSIAALELLAAAYGEAGRFEAAAAAIDEAARLVQPGQRPSLRELQDRAAQYRRQIPKTAAP